MRAWIDFEAAGSIGGDVARGERVLNELRQAQQDAANLLRMGVTGLLLQPLQQRS